nr:NAD(P)-binding domain-containing protein [uncultured Mogibacterium sp.]
MNRRKHTMKVGFIGLGIMGRPMAEHMVKAGLDVMVSDLNEKIVAELVAEGATAGSNKDLAEQCDVVEMILPNASIVKNVIFGEGGLMDYMKAGQIVVDHSSVTANDSRECYEKLQEKGIGFLDAPVSGGESGAKAGVDPEKVYKAIEGGAARSYALEDKAWKKTTPLTLNILRRWQTPS